MILLTILFLQTSTLIIFYQNVCYFYHHTNYWSPDLLKHPITEKQCEIVIDYHTVMFDDIIREDVKKVENVKIVEVFNFKGNYNSFYKSFLENEKFVKKECNSFIEFRNKDYFDTSTMKCEKRIEKLNGGKKITISGVSQLVTTNSLENYIDDNVEEIYFEDGIFTIDLEINSKNIKNIQFPHSVVNFEFSLKNNDKMKSITIPIFEIKRLEFINCVSLETITIFGNITSKTYYNFKGSRNIKEIYYFGYDNPWGSRNVFDQIQPKIYVCNHYQNSSFAGITVSKIADSSLCPYYEHRLYEIEDGCVVSIAAVVLSCIFSSILTVVIFESFYLVKWIGKCRGKKISMNYYRFYLVIILFIYFFIIQIFAFISWIIHMSQAEEKEKIMYSLEFFIELALSIIQFAPFLMMLVTGFKFNMKAKFMLMFATLVLSWISIQYTNWTVFKFIGELPSGKAFKNIVCYFFGGDTYDVGVNFDINQVTDKFGDVVDSGSSMISLTIIVIQIIDIIQEIDERTGFISKIFPCLPKLLEKIKSNFTDEEKDDGNNDGNNNENDDEKPKENNQENKDENNNQNQSDNNEEKKNDKNNKLSDTDRILLGIFEKQEENIEDEDPEVRLKKWKESMRTEYKTFRGDLRNFEMVYLMVPEDMNKKLKKLFHFLIKISLFFQSLGMGRIWVD